MNEAARSWFEQGTFTAEDFPAQHLLARKGDLRISVVIPARNERSTVGQIVRTIRAELMDAVPLVDELLVMDSDSTDDTAQTAINAGAMVRSARDIAPQLGWRPGKGEAMWKSLFVVTGDIIAFIDADLTSFVPNFVTGLLGPLLDDQRIQLVKGCYDRDLGSQTAGIGQGGRVTELMARPMISLWWPELAGVMQPLSGEWAARRAFLDSIPFPAGYGVECAVLIDAYRLHGLHGIAQVDLGKRTHAHQDLASLSVMAAEVLAAAQRRRFPGVHADGDTISHPNLTADGTTWSTCGINDEERPAHATMRARSTSS
ncbi:MAG: glucosyl-3-phosphoglycerate synthase [Actinomycetales bacterium]